MGTWKADRSTAKRRARGRYKARQPSTRPRRRWPQSKTDALATVQKTSLSRGVFGLPDEFTTRLRYVDVYALTSNSGSIAKQYMRMNSIQDPDQTGTGHQPYYHDQLVALYNRYCVLGSKMIVTFSLLPSAIATAQPSGPMICGVVADDSGSTSNTLSTVLESSTCKSTFVGSQNGGPNVKTFVLTYSPSRDLGLSPDDDTVGAAVGSNPTSQWYGLAFAAETGLSTASTVSVKIEMEYYVKFSQIKDIAGS